jgi:hypothetical protein
VILTVGATSQVGYLCGFMGTKRRKTCTRCDMLPTISNSQSFLNKTPTFLFHMKPCSLRSGSCQYCLCCSPQGLQTTPHHIVEHFLPQPFASHLTLVTERDWENL